MLGSYLTYLSCFPDESSSESDHEETAPHSGGHNTSQHHSLSSTGDDEQKSKSHEDNDTSEKLQPTGDGIVNAELIDSVGFLNSNYEV